MLDVEQTNNKLENMYAEICEKTSIYTKEEAIELFETNNFSADQVLILPLGCSEFDENEDIDLTTEIEYDEDILDVFDNYSDEHKFMIDLPEEFADIKASTMFKEYLFSNLFTNEERKYIFETLIDGTLKYHNHRSINESDNTKNEIGRFINDCGINDFIVRFVSDKNFCKFVFNIYSILFFEIGEEKFHNIEKLTTINDLIREKYTLIHNKNIELGYSDSDSIMVILKYLNGEIRPSSLNLAYKQELGDYKIQDISHKDYIKIVMITDYLRAIEIKYPEYDPVDKEYISFLKKNTKDNILKRFNNDKDFAFNVITEFLELNLFYSIQTKKGSNNMELIKRLNPLYKLDFM